MTSGAGFLVLAVLVTLAVRSVHSMLNGMNAAKGQLPYMASITFRDGTPYCGGAILNSRYVITSGHMLNKHEPKEHSVYLGAWRFDDEDALKSEIAEFIIHPEYKYPSKLYDIALVRLVDEILFSKFRQPINLPKIDYPDISGLSLLVSGFGLEAVPYHIMETMHRAKNLQYYDVSSITSHECIEKYKAIDEPRIDRIKYLTNQMVCAENPEGKGLCLGDEGNPLVAKETLVGIASWGCGCVSQYLGVYTKVFPHLE